MNGNLEYFLAKLLGVFMPFDFIIFILIIYSMKKIKNWAVRIFVSFGIYLVTSELIGYLINSSNGIFLKVFAAAFILILFKLLSIVLNKYSITDLLFKNSPNEKDTSSIDINGNSCPKCYSEYNSDINICVDCNIPLKNSNEEE
mgnify:CR=1 FL=1